MLANFKLKFIQTVKSYHCLKAFELKIRMAPKEIAVFVSIVKE
jgi:hypothetical protein